MTFSVWNWIFLSASAVCFAGNLGYVVFISADNQPWNDIEPTPVEDVNEEEKSLESDL